MKKILLVATVAILNCVGAVQAENIFYKPVLGCKFILGRSEIVFEKVKFDSVLGHGHFMIDLSQKFTIGERTITINVNSSKSIWNQIDNLRPGLGADIDGIGTGITTGSLWLNEKTVLPEQNESFGQISLPKGSDIKIRCRLEQRIVKNPNDKIYN